MATYSGVSSIKVHPGIGLARVGNSEEYFIGPETPGTIPDPGNGQYKDASGALKPQAQRYRVYGYADSGTVVGEITDGDTVNGFQAHVSWKVHLTNMKAANYAFQGQYAFDPKQLRNSTIQNDKDIEPHERDKLIIDPGAKEISGTSAGPVELLDPVGSKIFDVPDGELPSSLKFDRPQQGTDPVKVSYTPVTVSLGNLYTDDKGRLIVVGGAGDAGSCTTPSVVISKITSPPSHNPEYNGNSYFNNPGWYDDTSGGSIDASVIDSANITQFTTEGDATKTGWLAVAPPNYSPSTDNVVSLLDLQLDIFPDQDYGGQVNFYRDIYPILKTVTDYAWTNHRAFIGHAPGSPGDFLRPGYIDQLADPTNALGVKARQTIFGFIRAGAEITSVPAPPNYAVPPGSPAIFSDQPQRSDLMPRLFGNGGSPAENETNGTTFPNQWLSLTDHQLGKFQSWVDGNFVMGDKSGPPRWSDLPEPQRLDFAALQPTVGGGFHPGIELTYLMHEPTFFQEAFRFASGTLPGSIAAYMSVPWQGDFWSCNISWWPAIRPDIVVERDTQDPPNLTAIQWFRAPTIPPNANSIADYEGGYRIMVDDWPRFGLVTPVTGATDQGEQIYEEVERDVSLNNKTVITYVDPDNNPTVFVLTYDAGVNGVVVSRTVTAASQWELLSYSGSPTQFFIGQKNGDGSANVLTADFSGPVNIARQLSPADDSQLWQYVPSGYPGVFSFKSNLTLEFLANEGEGSMVRTTTPENGGTMWQLTDGT